MPFGESLVLPSFTAAVSLASATPLGTSQCQLFDPVIVADYSEVEVQTDHCIVRVCFSMITTRFGTKYCK